MWLVAAGLLALGATSIEPAAEPVSSMSLDAGGASAEELSLVRGVGPVLAGRIVLARTTAGSPPAPDDLLAVDGVGERLLENVSRRLDPASLPPPSEARTDDGR